MGESEFTDDDVANVEDRMRQAAAPVVDSKREGLAQSLYAETSDTHYAMTMSDARDIAGRMLRGTRGKPLVTPSPGAGREVCDLRSRWRSSDAFATYGSGPMWCHTHDLPADHGQTATDWQAIALRVGDKWSAVLEHYDLAEDAQPADVILAALGAGSTRSPAEESGS